MLKKLLESGNCYNSCMKIAILGFAGQGQSAYDYWNHDGNEITICDRDTSLQLSEGVHSQLGNEYLNNLDRFDLLIRTPALHPRDIVTANANNSQILEKVWSNTNEFFKVCPTKNIIGVTGTKGKGTTSTLITKMLESAGKRVHLGGNIGTPPLDLLKNQIDTDDWVVLELANFQLIDLKTSPHIAICLMVVPEHLDWHDDLEEYISAKQQLFIHQDEKDIAIYYADNENSLSVADASSGKLIPYYQQPGAIVSDEVISSEGQEICKTHELKLLGKHNWQNVCAAVTVVWQVTQDIEAIRSIATSFSGLEHRLEFVREYNDVKYYNDSFAATPEAAAASITAIPGKKVMIIGGFDRQLDLSNLVAAVSTHGDELRKVLVIGVSAERTAKELGAAGFTNFEVLTDKTMEAIVAKAQITAQSGDAVVLSPGFPSFDMFKNFEDRGVQYKTSVNNLS